MIDGPRRWLIFDGVRVTATLVQDLPDGQLIMSPNECIVSLGAKSVYVAVTDDDGIQRLRRHPWPPTTAR